MKRVAFKFALKNNSVTLELEICR